jgi:hypothetical protein
MLEKSLLCLTHPAAQKIGKHYLGYNYKKIIFSLQKNDTTPFKEIKITIRNK